MERFLRENWLWILAPIALVVGLVILVAVQSHGAESPFIYNIR
ncbi:MAG TPA: DUF5989 family protein [Planctomycetota bacterium]|nr:DUF5989 family protein [Planctomycetota bacterium]